MAYVCVCVCVCACVRVCVCVCTMKALSGVSVCVCCVHTLGGRIELEIFTKKVAPNARFCNMSRSLLRCK